MKNRPLGTQAAPVCEGGVFAPVRLMTADCSRDDRAVACARRATARRDQRSHRARAVAIVGAARASCQCAPCALFRSGCRSERGWTFRRRSMARKLKSDKLLFTATLLLVCTSVVMVYSASAVMAMEHSTRPVPLPVQTGDVGAARPGARADRDARSTTATTGSRRSSGPALAIVGARAGGCAVRAAGQRRDAGGSASAARRAAVGARQDCRSSCSSRRCSSGAWTASTKSPIRAAADRRWSLGAAWSG